MTTIPKVPRGEDREVNRWRNNLLNYLSQSRDLSALGIEFGRGATDTDITYIALRNASGTKCYVYPNAAGNAITVSTTKP
jgi:hypothetical protein